MPPAISRPAREPPCCSGAPDRKTGLVSRAPASLHSTYHTRPSPHAPRVPRPRGMENERGMRLTCPGAQSTSNPVTPFPDSPARSDDAPAPAAPPAHRAASDERRAMSPVSSSSDDLSVLLTQPDPDPFLDDLSAGDTGDPASARGPRGDDCPSTERTGPLATADADRPLARDGSRRTRDRWRRPGARTLCGSSVLVGERSGPGYQVHALARP